MMSRESIRALAGTAYDDPLLKGLQTPDPAFLDSPEAESAAGPALFALHLGVAFHRKAIVSDVMQSYARRSGLDRQSYPPLCVLDPTTGGETADCIAMQCYDASISVDESLAEAHYNRARLFQRQGNRHAALQGFRSCLEHPPHERCSPHAHLHANAHWESAGLCEAIGQTEAALQAYRAALAGLGQFGVHHVRVARFFRKQGLADEAVAEFRKCMGYSHRYFPEFMPPALVPEQSGPEMETDCLYETAGGAFIVFWQGRYHALPASIWHAVADGRTALTQDLVDGTPQAASIAGLETAVATD